MATPRTLPRGLDLMAALGSAAARNELQRAGDFKFRNFDAQLGKVTQQFSALTPADWNANLYSGWLYTLAALAKPEARDGRFPAFMRTPAWSRKELLTALGSWTELRHDTLLYAKQVMAEMGGGEEPEHPRGYVEPNLALWARLLELEQQTRAVLKAQSSPVGAHRQQPRQPGQHPQLFCSRSVSASSPAARSAATTMTGFISTAAGSKNSPPPAPTPRAARTAAPRSSAKRPSPGWSPMSPPMRAAVGCWKKPPAPFRNSTRWSRMAGAAPRSRAAACIRSTNSPCRWPSA